MWIDRNFPAIADDTVKGCPLRRDSRIVSRNAAIIHSVMRLFQWYSVAEHGLCPRRCLFPVAPTQIALCCVKEHGAENRAKYSPVSQPLFLLFLRISARLLPYPPLPSRLGKARSR